MNTENIRAQLQEINALIQIENELGEEGGEMALVKKRLARQQLLENIQKTKALLAELEIENSQ